MTRSERRRTRDARTVLYRESLRTPWPWYLVAVFATSLLAAEFHIGKYNVTDWLPFAILLPLAAVMVWLMGHSSVEISDGELRVRGAHLPLSEVSGAVALDRETLRRVVGREGDPAAFVSIRPWIGPGVQIWLDDPEDPTPYWVLSSRTPQHLVEVLRSTLP